MRFRPCIDIHNGRVKQIVGSSLRDAGDSAVENFVAEADASSFARMFREDNLPGGHVILLNPSSSPLYESTKRQALEALAAYPGGLQVGGGITPANAEEFLDAGAAAVIVTSYVFREGRIDFARLNELARAVGKDRLVLDLSCRKGKDQAYHIVTDRWQVFTEEKLDAPLLDALSGYACEFLVHAVDIEGKGLGIERELAALLGGWAGIPITYAGGIRSLEDIEEIRTLGQGRLDFTVGSALDLYGGKLPYQDMLRFRE